MIAKEVIPYAPGTPAFMARVAELNDKLNASIPEEFKLSAEILDNLPLNVMGVPESCGILTPAEVAITNLDTVAIRNKIAAGELTSVAVTTAFCKRAAIAHQLVHCLVDYFYEEAIDKARELDEYFAKTGKVIGPLHGVPISIDHMPMKGRLASAGYLATLQMCDTDGDQVSILRAAGAVFYCKTNQPQGIMHLECHSFWGRTTNPYNTKLTPGGSSGGASALIAMKGSTMSPGTDIGGSIRQPCAQTGIYGMRPTSQTMPTGGHLFYQGGWDGIVCSTGPMCASQRDMELFFEVVLGAEPSKLDPYVIPTTWKLPDLSSTKIKVGVMYHDGYVLPHPPMLRGLKTAAQKLAENPQFEVVEYSPFEHQRALDIARELYFPDGTAKVHEMLEATGEAILPLTEHALAPPFCKDHSVLEMYELMGRRDAYRKEHLKHWMSQGIDVLLCPAFPGTAQPHDTARYWSYTSQWNLVDYPGIVWPSGLYVDAALDPVMADFTPMSPKDEENMSYYNAELMMGSPISLQLVSRKFNDHFLVAAQKLIDQTIKA